MDQGWINLNQSMPRWGSKLQRNLRLCITKKLGGLWLVVCVCSSGQSRVDVSTPHGENNQPYREDRNRLTICTESKRGQVSSMTYYELHIERSNDVHDVQSASNVAISSSNRPISDHNSGEYEQYHVGNCKVKACLQICRKLYFNLIFPRTLQQCPESHPHSNTKVEYWTGKTCRNSHC